MGEDEPSCCALRSEDLIESGGKQMLRKGTGQARSELSEKYAVALEGMQMEKKVGCRILTGEIVDEPHLYAILDLTNGLGLELLPVEALPEDANTFPGARNRRLKGSEL